MLFLRLCWLNWVCITKKYVDWSGSLYEGSTHPWSAVLVCAGWLLIHVLVAIQRRISLSHEAPKSYYLLTSSQLHPCTRDPPLHADGCLHSTVITSVVFVSHYRSAVIYESGSMQLYKIIFTAATKSTGLHVDIAETQNAIFAFVQRETDHRYFDLPGAVAVFGIKRTPFCFHSS